MTPKHPPPENFYDAHVAARRQVYSHESVWDRVFEPTALISIVLLLVSGLVHLYGSSITPEAAISLIGTCLWDVLIFVVPRRLLNAMDDWLNPSLAPRPPLRRGQSIHEAKSETMRKILGLDSSEGMMASVFQARSRALSMTGSVLGLKGEPNRPAGLGNRDNSCYQNSILQGLASLQHLPEYLSAHLQALDSDSDDQDVAQTLRALISDLNDISNNGRTLWTPGVLKSMSTWTQQDAQEYFSKILDDVDKSVARATKNTQQLPGFETSLAKDDTTASQHSDDSGYQSIPGPGASDTKLPRNPLEGLLAQRVACVQCGHSDGLSMIPFTCLTLSLGLNKNQHDLYERLDAYTNIEAVENVECAKCTLLKAQRLLTKLVERMREGSAPEAQMAEPVRRLESVELALEEDDFDDKTLTEKCKITQAGKVTTTKTKQIVVARPPQSLAIHMNRSVFDPSTFNMMKNSAPVNFPKFLDLGPWCLGSAGAGVAGIPEADAEEQWLSDPRKSMIAGDLDPSRLTGPIYELRAVVTHYGHHENGHYICYRKHVRHKPPPPQGDPKKEAPPLEPGEQDGEPQDGDPASESDVMEAVANREADEPTAEVPTDWWRLSDQNVTRANEETVLNLSPGVFMLFYDCVDPNTVLASEDEDDGMQDACEGVEGPDTTAQTPRPDEAGRRLGEGPSAGPIDEEAVDAVEQGGGASAETATEPTG